MQAILEFAAGSDVIEAVLIAIIGGVYFRFTGQRLKAEKAAALARYVRDLAQTFADSEEPLEDLRDRLISSARKQFRDTLRRWADLDDDLLEIAPVAIKAAKATRSQRNT